MQTSPTVHPGPSAAAGPVEGATRRPPFIFHWSGWRQFGRDFVVLQLGLALMGLSVALLRGTGLGQIPWGVVEYALEPRMPMAGWSALLLVFLVIAAVTTLLALALGEPFGWGSVGNFVFLTLVWMDAFEGIVPTLTTGLAAQLLYLLAGTLLMAFGTALYVSVGAGAGPRDTFNLALARRLHVGVGLAWTIVQGGLLLVGWLLGGTFGPGTFLFAVAIGPALQLAFSMLGIEPGAEFWHGRPGSPRTVAAGLRLRFSH